MNVLLHLWNRRHWELKGRPDIVRFFQVLRTAFPTATTLFIEGTSIAEDVREFLSSPAEGGPYLPATQTIWPRPKQIRVRADETTLTRLAELAAQHAEPEILDHLFLYSETEPLMEYPDAFCRNCPIFVAHDVAEPQVRWFARELNLEVAEVGAA